MNLVKCIWEEEEIRGLSWRLLAYFYLAWFLISVDGSNWKSLKYQIQRKTRPLFYYRLVISYISSTFFIVWDFCTMFWLFLASLFNTTSIKTFPEILIECQTAVRYRINLMQVNLSYIMKLRQLLFLLSMEIGNCFSKI